MFLAVVAGVTGMVVGAVLVAGPVDAADTGGNFTVLAPSALQGNVYLWGVHSDQMSYPVTVREYGALAAPPEPSDTVDMANVPWHGLPAWTGTDAGFRVLPYRFNAQPRAHAIWVPEDSDIGHPSDLDGATVGIGYDLLQDADASPAAMPAPFRSSFILLRAWYGADVRVTGKSTAAEEIYGPANRVAHPDVDAVFLPGPTRLPANHSLRPVFLPMEEMDRRFGDAALPTFLVVRDRAAVDRAFRVVEAMQRSARLAQTQRSAFKEQHFICNEFLVDTDRRQIAPMTSDAVDALQFFLDAAHEQRQLDRRIVLDDLFVREDVWIGPGA